MNGERAENRAEEAGHEGAQLRAEAGAQPRDPFVWHVLLVIALSVAFESLFIHHSLNVTDEGWPLYAAMQLNAGGTLYQDVFFVFPPGHLLVAWLAYVLDPPGVVLARIFYAAFSVALCVGIYVLGRRVAPARFALVGALLLSGAAMPSHMHQLLFGYRYLVISLIAILAFDHYLSSKQGRWLFIAGCLTGAALVFRLTPAFAVGCAIGVGVIAAGGGPRDWLRDWTRYGAGIALIALPVVLYFVYSVGPEKLWLEVVVRPVAMTEQQSLPMPTLRWHPVYATRQSITIWFVGVQFRAFLLLYFGYAIALGVAWLRALRDGRRFEHTLLLVIVIWGGLFFLRSLGRSDSAHLYSAIPPVCLLLGHLASLAYKSGGEEIATWRRRSKAAVGIVLFGLWFFLGGTDLPFDRENRGTAPLASLDDRVFIGPKSSIHRVDDHVALLRRATRPGDTILDLSASPLFHVLTDRLGPGHADLLMPGTFLSDQEEIAFLERLVADPPAVVIFPGWLFDKMEERSIRKTAPRIKQWVAKNYEHSGKMERYTLMWPRSAEPKAQGAGSTRAGMRDAKPGER
jgi:hypothetical protein